MNLSRRITDTAVIALICSVLGCGGESTESDAQAAANASEADSGSSERCEKKLAAAMQRIQPTSMATQTRPDLVVNSLNSWLTECVGDRIAELEVGEQTQAMLSPSAIRLTTAGRFTLNDAMYIRDCLLLNALTERVWQRTDLASESGLATEVARVTALFDAVNQLVTLLPNDSSRVPVGLYETLLTGQGTTEDRIWLFAEALRQRQIDAVLLKCSQPAAADGGQNPLDSAELLIAVMAEPDVLLFDPVRVTAVPKPNDDSVIVTQPAGLPELAQSERWKDATVQLIAQAAMSAPRMLVLQENMSASDSAMLFDELGGGTSEFKSQRDRVVEAADGRWTAADIQVWPYPTERHDAASGLSEEERQQYARLMKPFDAPFERDPLKSDGTMDDIDVSNEALSPEERMQLMQVKLQERIARMNESSEEIFGTASRRLLKVRIEQVMGDSDIGVIQQLQQIRIASMHDYVEIQVRLGEGDGDAGLVQVALPDAIQAIHNSATGDALFWSAMCQIDRGDQGAAVITLRNYRSQYPEGSQLVASLVHEARALLDLGATEQAVKVLQSIDKDAAEHQRVAWLLSRLAPQESAAAPVSDDEAADDQPVEPVQPTPAASDDPAGDKA